MALQEQGLITEHEEVAKDFYRLVIKSPEIAAQAKPGQFVHVLTGSRDSLDPLLRRPISLYGIDAKAGTITLLYQVVGKGTEALARKHKGMHLDIMGPLGNGFTFDSAGKCLVVAGGIGVAPLLPVLRELAAKKISAKVVLGARNVDWLLARTEIEALGLPLEIATDDGSLGHHGFVTDLVKRELAGEDKPTYFYACGPEPMLRALAPIMEKAGVPGEFSLEERMGCGVGACLACVCKIKVKETSKQVTTDNLSWSYKKVCLDGPVFKAGEVAWDE